jgi:ABC-type Mn2+/Zn2+ transport system ATPase subunit
MDFASADAVLEVEGASIAYEERVVLRDLSFRIPQGTRVAVVGPNGAGKSSLFKALVGLLPLKAGRILIHDFPLGGHRDCVAYVPQRGDVDWNFPVTVRDVVAMGRYGHLGWFRRARKRDRSLVADCLDQMGMTDLADRSINELSGGQQQRIFLARALAQEPHIFLMDEPFNGIDRTTVEATMLLLDRLRKEGVTVLISTHDLNLAATRFDRVLLLNKVLVADGLPAEVLREENLTRAFGSALLVTEGRNLLVDECCGPEGHTVGHDDDHEHGNWHRGDAEGSRHRGDAEGSQHRDEAQGSLQCDDAEGGQI